MEDGRNIKQVMAISSVAKLDPCDLTGQPQCLYFSEDLNPSNMKLVEVDSSVMAYIEEGKDLVIRGDKTESAVMCLEDMTFDLKEAQTSNTLLLLDKCLGFEDFEDDGPDLHHFEIQGVAHKYFELRPMRPKLQKLRLLLNKKNTYAGDIYEDSPEHSGQKFAMDDLLDKVQASQKEIIEELEQIRACCITGFWRLLDFDYEFEVLSQILSLMEENSWQIDCIPLEETLETLEELKPRLIVQHVMGCFGEQNSKSESEDEDTVTYALNEDRICRLYAEMLLKHTDKFNLLEFLQAWQQSVPEGMNTSEHQLKGLALIDRASKPQVISLFKTTSLPENERDRFNFLFKTKERWTMDEISPYLEDLAEGKLKIGALLQKYARTSTGPSGVRVYNSKRPIT